MVLPHPEVPIRDRLGASYESLALEARIMLAVAIGPEGPIVNPSITEPEVAFVSQ